ncbi:unnamed protein product, partial [Cladocopium goreaui]
VPTKKGCQKGPTERSGNATALFKFNRTSCFLDQVETGKPPEAGRRKFQRGHCKFPSSQQLCCFNPECDMPTEVLTWAQVNDAARWPLQALEIKLVFGWSSACLRLGAISADSPSGSTVPKQRHVQVRAQAVGQSNLVPHHGKLGCWSSCRYQPRGSWHSSTITSDLSRQDSIWLDVTVLAEEDRVKKVMQAYFKGGRWLQSRACQFRWRPPGDYMATFAIQKVENGGKVVFNQLEEEALDRRHFGQAVTCRDLNLLREGKLARVFADSLTDLDEGIQKRKGSATVEKKFPALPFTAQQIVEKSIRSVGFFSPGLERILRLTDLADDLESSFEARSVGLQAEAADDEAGWGRRAAGCFTRARLFQIALAANLSFAATRIGSFKEVAIRDDLCTRYGGAKLGSKFVPRWKQALLVVVSGVAFRLEGKQSTLPVVEPKKKDTFISRQTITFPEIQLEGQFDFAARKLKGLPDDLPLPHRQRLNEEVELESKRTLEPEDVSSSKVQRISAIVTPDFADVKGNLKLKSMEESSKFLKRFKLHLGMDLLVKTTGELSEGKA